MVDASTEAEHGDLSPARYALIYVCLLILTVATYSLSRLSLGTALAAAPVGGRSFGPWGRLKS